MCGINGFLFSGIQPSNDSIDARIKKMNNLIIHRGPDDDGIFIETNKEYSIAMGMRRLSIIDLSNGTQPIYSDDKEVIIVFNGEIYNYKVLKTKLESKNIVFKTNSDTEVILKMYLEYGVDSFLQLDGMFVFSIYDKRVNKVFITRDFFGEKPLYYSNVNGRFIWGSELKSMKSQLSFYPEISKKGLELFFSLTYIPAPYTIYEGVSKLEPNNYIEYSIEEKELSIHKIQKELVKENAKFSGTFNEAKQKTKELVEESVYSRSVSDVPIGTFLSGGVDSSIVSHCLAKNTASKINTFSIGFEKKSFDETDKSRVVAKQINSNHREFIINEKSLFSNLDNILENFDEPFADASALPTFLVSKKTSEHVKVALTGDGGDEVFGGYNKYYINNINKNFTKLFPEKGHQLLKKTISPLLKTKDDNRGFRFKVKKAIDSIDYNNNFYWNIISLGFKEYEINLLLKKKSSDIFEYYKKDLNLNKSESLYDLRMIDKHVSLEGDMLVKVDRTSMLSSLECRAPFLNKKVWNFTNSLPDNYLIHKRSKKYILKEAFKDVFPSNFLEKSKKGFGVPVGDWLRASLKEELITYSTKDFVEEQNLFNYEYIAKLVNNHLKGFEDNTFKVWSYYCFQKWYKKSFLN
jgi:asparagine synthase (glutamine-hydrolysing)